MYKDIIKPILDFLLALLIFMFAWPFLLVAAVAIKLDSPGPVFFTQERVGKDNELFKVYKLRTMMVKSHDADGKKIRDKYRITRAGSVIRKLSLDEIPQLFNILKGDMSFIGPRPLLVRYYPYYTDEELRRHNVRPGLTGLAQINGRSNLMWEERFKYDVEYVDNLSFLLDIKIALKTVQKVISGSDASASERPAALVDFDKHRGYEKRR